METKQTTEQALRDEIAGRIEMDALDVQAEMVHPRNAEMDDLAKAMHANPAFRVANVVVDLRAALASQSHKEQA